MKPWIRVINMARTKFRSKIRRKRGSYFYGKRPAEAANVPEPKRTGNTEELEQVTLQVDDSTTERAAGSSFVTDDTADKSPPTTISAKKLSLKQPKISIDTTQSSSEDNSASSSDSGSEIDGTTECDSDSEDVLTNGDIDERDEDDGYRIVHLQSFNHAIGQAVLCAKCKSGTVSIFEAKNARHGLASHLQVLCSQCNSKHIVPYPKTQTTKSEKEVNQRAVLACRLIGRGQKAMRKFFSVMNMPGFTSKRTYDKYLRRLCTAADEEAKESMKTAAEEVFRLQEEDHSLSNPAEDGMLEIAVTCDGTWHKRGYSSLHGVVIIISLLSGQVLDYAILSKSCEECKTWEKRSGTPEYEAWKSNHNCLLNFEGTSNAMECEGALRMWLRSEKLYKLQYTQIISDGDSKTFKLLSERKPYTVPITKMECVGHVQKRMGTGLRKIKKDKKLGGRGRLTDHVIDSLQTYYGKAIRSNSGDLEGMQRAVWAILYHSASTDEKPQHEFCPDGPNSWCKYKRGEPYVHKNALPEEIVLSIKPLFERLSDATLLQKCLHGFTQNQNESLNKEIWSLCPKTEYVGARTIQTAVALAVSVWNNGWSSIQRIQKRLNLTSSIWLSKLVKTLNSERLKAAHYRSLSRVKQARKVRRRQRKKKYDLKKAEEGETYCPGAF